VISYALAFYTVSDATTRCFKENSTFTVMLRRARFYRVLPTFGWVGSYVYNGPDIFTQPHPKV